MYIFLILDALPRAEETIKVSFRKFKEILIDELIDHSVDIISTNRKKKERVINVQKHLNILKKNDTFLLIQK